MDGLEEDLAAYYDKEAAARAERAIDPARVARRDEFLALLRAERRRTLLEAGTGRGRDATAFIDAGIDVTGIDLSSEQVRLARLVGVDAHQASVFTMPFPPRSFEAGWTMSVPTNASGRCSAGSDTWSGSRPGAARTRPGGTTSGRCSGSPRAGRRPPRRSGAPHGHLARFVSRAIA